MSTELHSFLFYLLHVSRCNSCYQICLVIPIDLEIMLATASEYHNQPNHNPFKLVFTSNPSLGRIPNPRRLLTLNSRKATKCLLIHSPSSATGEPNTGLPSFAFLLCSPATWLHTTAWADMVLHQQHLRRNPPKRRRSFHAAANQRRSVGFGCRLSVVFIFAPKTAKAQKTHQYLHLARSSSSSCPGELTPIVIKVGVSWVPSQ